MTQIYHITSRRAWQAAQARGDYHAPSLDTEGFIHCSRADQILKVANAFYRGQGDLVILCIQLESLTSVCKWEDPAHPNGNTVPTTGESEKFPHVYGEINLTAVMNVLDFQAGDDGLFTLPSDLS